MKLWIANILEFEGSIEDLSKNDILGNGETTK